MLTGPRSARTSLTMGAAALAALLLVACHKALPPDGVCSYEPLPGGGTGSFGPSFGPGGIQALASTDAHSAVREATGKQIASGHVNAITPIPAGDYQVVLNNSTHATSAQSKMLTKCTTGAVLVNGKTDEYYAVVDQAAQQLASAHLGSALSLFPGSYQVRLNNTDSAANLQSGAMLRTET